MNGLGNPIVVADTDRSARLRSLCAALPQSTDFLLDETDYVLGRFLPGDLSSYLSACREGRGAAPRMDRPIRQRLLDEVINPYREWKRIRGHLDWNDLAVQWSLAEPRSRLDIVVVDEAQDFSANQIRAIRAHLASPFAMTFVLDTVQRIYARGFTWQEVGIAIEPGRSRRLTIGVFSFKIYSSLLKIQNAGSRYPRSNSGQSQLAANTAQSTLYARDSWRSVSRILCRFFYKKSRATSSKTIK